MGTNKSALIHAGLARWTGVLSWPQNHEHPSFALTHTLTPHSVQLQSHGPRFASSLLNSLLMVPWAWVATEWVCARGKRCPELLKRSGGGQRTSSPVEFCAVPRPGSDAWRSRRGSELRPHIYLWEQRAAAIDQLWKRRHYDPTQNQTICDSMAGDTLTTNTNEFKIQMYTNTRFKHM